MEGGEECTDVFMFLSGEWVYFCLLSLLQIDKRKRERERERERDCFVVFL